MVTVLSIIEKKVKEINNPKKILVSYDSWNKMVEEENLVGLFCVSCSNFVTEKCCENCKDGGKIIDKELPVFSILDLPFEMSSNVEGIKII